MRSVVLAVSITVVSLFLAIPAAQRLFAAPMSGTVEVAVSPGGQMMKTPGGLGATLPFNYAPASLTSEAGHDHCLDEQDHPARAAHCHVP